MMVRPNSRKLTILAQDPSVRINGRLAFSQVEIPNEVLSDGPWGHRVKVVDYDASAGVLYSPRSFGRDEEGQLLDPFAPPRKMSAAQRKTWEANTLADPRFHAQHVYAIVMRTLARFEFALGRRVSWGFPGHQINVAPHAFCEANAYYSEEDRALLFGYFPASKPGEFVFTCLSHDIVAHETTHALLDGLRDSFTNPSTPDQAAFHEGFADVVALLSVFSLPEMVEAALCATGKVPQPGTHSRLIPQSAVTRDAIQDSLLLGLAEEFGAQLGSARASALRRSVELKPDRKLLSSAKYQEEHDRGEVFSAAMLRAFLDLWLKRIAALGTFDGDKYNLELVVEEGVKAADHLLTMSIRALDYCPPIDLTFGDYLAALLTADAETVPGDQRGYRAVVRKSFHGYGIDPPKACTDPATGQWKPFDDKTSIAYNRTHYDSMLHSKEEVFRFIWENRDALRLNDLGYMYVESVRLSVRQGPDGFFLRETVCEYVQVLRTFGAELEAVLGLKRPKDMPTNASLTVYGGGTLIFDEYGRIKYHIEQRLDEAKRQSTRIEYLWRRGLFDTPKDARNRFANMHLHRVL